MDSHSEHDQQGQNPGDRSRQNEPPEKQPALVTPRHSISQDLPADSSVLSAEQRIENPLAEIPSNPAGRAAVDESPDATATTQHASREKDRQARQSAVNDMFSRLYWMLALAGMLFVIWKVGPRIVEEYQFAATRGQMRAEYANAVEQLEKQPLSNVSYAYQLVAEKVRPSVVSISTIRPEDGTRGQGSGVIMSSDGYILTNSHVVEDAAKIRVYMYDRHRYTATVIGSDPQSDLAVIKIDAPNLIPADWGDSDELKVGSIVWAIGNPYGLDQTVTSGIISGVNRLDEEHRNRELLQTDAAVNPGNSGGPLVDAEGKVIGINTSIFGDTFQGISFAVPSSVARFVYEEIRKKGEVTRGFLGVEPTPVYQDMAHRLKLPDLDGAVIRVHNGSPAYQSGLMDHDVIRFWNGIPISVHTNLFRLVEMTPPNGTVPVTIVRNGEEMVLPVTVGDRQDYGR